MSVEISTNVTISLPDDQIVVLTKEEAIALRDSLIAEFPVTSLIPWTPTQPNTYPYQIWYTGTGADTKQTLQPQPRTPIPEPIKAGNVCGGFGADVTTRFGAGGEIPLRHGEGVFSHELHEQALYS